MAARRGLFGRGRAPSPQELERQDLEESLSQTRLALAQAYAGFNAVSDPELVESYVYEIQALQSRYAYFLRRRKSLEPAPAPAAQAALPAV